ncbi:MAG: xanthine dehydrogenase family protein subunit M [Alphaproteobacteria bacterium]|nr:xanthine dehydrogenase family protein subunit M [Alphaproteobacteria bacterium]MCZ6849719.1 xanthine dehydrogenase family protein subunit M [Alphaproteobacteria bacterium]
MKAAPFEYFVADSIDEVTTGLADSGEEATIIAGGQTLVPLMAMRLARPALLIDVNGIGDLQGIDLLAGGVRIKACTRQSDALKSTIIGERLPLLAKALPYVGHAQTRNRGTVGGSIALGDPAAEIPLVATALDARITLVKKGNSRELSIHGFYQGPMMTSREPDECITEILFPQWQGEGRRGTGFQEVSLRHGDFAIVAAAAQILVGEDGVCRRASVALGGVSGTPFRISAAEDALRGTMIDDPALRAVANAVDQAVDPQSDLHASASYRRRVAKVLVERVIREAAREAANHGARDAP